MAGAPKGNRNSAKGREWAAAIERVLRTYENKRRKISKGQALERIAVTVLEEALDGGFWAIQEIGNRLDGKPAQSIDFTDHTPNARELSDEQLLERIERAIHAAGAVEPQTGPEDPGAVHAVHQRTLDS